MNMSQKAKAIGAVILTLTMLLASGCSDNSQPQDDDVSSSEITIIDIPEDDDDTDDSQTTETEETADTVQTTTTTKKTEKESQNVKYSPSVYYDYWNNTLLPKYGMPKAVKLTISENKYAAVTGSASVCIADIDGDGQDEMLHVHLGAYGDNKDAMILEIYEFAYGKVKKAASAVVDESFTFFGNGCASVFLSKKGSKTYICFEEFGDFTGEARTTEYLILQYNGKALKYCIGIVDPGFTSETALFADTEGKSFKADKSGVSVFSTDYKNWEALYAENYEEDGTNVTGKYTDYKTALTTELEKYGISLRFSGSFNLGTKQDAKAITRICSHIITFEGSDDSVKTTAVLCDFTGSLTHTDQSAAKKITVDSKRQYNLNIYLSNFAEVNLPSFNGLPNTDALIEFGIHHNIKNRFSKTVDLKNSGDYTYRMSTASIADAIDSYFHVRTDESDYSAFAKSDRWMTYKKGYLYSSDVAEGAPWGDFTVVSKAESIGKDMYKITFANYDINDFYDKKGGTDKPYSLTPSQIKKLKISKHQDGTAILYATDLAKRSTYRLLAYNLK